MTDRLNPSPAGVRLFGRLLGRRPAVHLLYHGVASGVGEGMDSRTLERHIAFLRRHFEIVPAAEAITEIPGSRAPRVAISFDDGYRNNAEVAAPILRRHRVPATFFVCRRHTRSGQYLWFSYLRALGAHFKGNGFMFEGRFIDMSGAQRHRSIERLRGHLLGLRPHPRAMYAAIERELPPISDFVSASDLRMHYAGMTEEQTAELAEDDLFSVQAHTEDHPFLTRCEPEEAERQIADNKAWIERLTGRTCDEVAYPSGAYDRGTIEICRRLGFHRAFAVIPKSRAFSVHEIPRVGVYSKSLKVLAIKAGFGHWIRAWGVPVG